MSFADVLGTAAQSMHAEQKLSQFERLRREYPEGQVVYLKTGSPPLLVEWNRTDGIISVVWFEGGKSCRDAFHPDALTKTKP